MRVSAPTVVAALALAGASALEGAVARADAAIYGGVTYGGEAYQKDVLNQARVERGLEVDPSPRNKLIERVVVAPYDVILEDEPYPGFMNWFHSTTRPYVVERELLFRAGDRWSDDRVAESARNLRTYLFVSSARIVACKGSASDRVVALVVTKDTWSLRPNANFVFLGSVFQSVDAELTEENFLGRNKRTTIDLGLDLATYYGGFQYNDPRLIGTELTYFARGDLIWNRSSGVLEGGVARFSLQQPLRNLATPWGWVADFRYRQDIYRLFSGTELAVFESPTTAELVPYVLKRHLLDLQLGLTRSLGRERKHNFSAGYRAFVHRYAVPPLDYPTAPATQADFESMVVPLTESAGLLYVSYHTFQATFRELVDIESYAVSEDYRFGLDLSTELRLAQPVFGFNSSFLEPIVNVKWTLLASDDLFSVSAGFDTRYQPGLTPESAWINGLLTSSIKNISPRFSILRLYTALSGGRRFNDLNHNFATLGGDTNLRGYPSKYFVGANYWVANAEIRTLPLPIATVHLGAAAFLDVGDASNDLTQLSAHASAGVGLRIGLPQFNREILRADFAVPLEAVADGIPAHVVVQYGQAF